MIGAYVRKGDLLAKVDEIERVSIEIPVLEKESADIAAGQPVMLKARAYPNHIFRGSVTAIAPVVTEDPANPERRILVMTELMNTDHLLKPLMTGMAKIDCGR